MIVLKKGVSINGIKPETVLAIQIVNDIYRIFKADLVITSVNDSKHGYGSLHYIGYAFDCRTFHLQEADIPQIVASIKKNLGDDFDVLLEKDHIHVEFQPKEGVNL